MSIVKIEGNASGTGTLTIAAPNTNSNISFSLPTTLGNAGNSAFVTTDASGNAGIGVTPTAWISTYDALQLNNTGALFATSGDVYLGNNVYLNSGDNVTYIANGTSTMYRQVSGQHIWYTATSGTAGNSITYAQPMRLNATGAVVLQGGNTSANGVGITFPATQSASSDVNTLDDYEEGTWTPVLTDGTNNATSNAETAGIYVKIGRTVYITATMYTTSLGSVSGAVYVSGLPFASANQNPKISLSIGYAELLNISANQVISAWIQANNSRITLSLWDSTGGVTALQASEWSADGIAFITGTYYV